jgi:hypothetical protein
LFVYYPYDDDHVYSPLHYFEKIYKSIEIKPKEYCSGELYGYKFTVPCNFIDYLKFTYTNWEEPKPSVGYRNLKEPRNFTINEKPYLVKYFAANGKFREEKTLEKANEFLMKFNTSISSFPKDFMNNIE